MLTDRQYEGMNNQLSGVIPPGGGSQSPSTLTYDAAGDVTNDTHTDNTYVYDAEGRVCAFETPNGLGGTTMVGYLYDGDGIRVAKGTITSMNCDPASNGFTLTEDYVLGPSGEELTMLNGSGTWQRSNVYGGGRQVATYDIAANPAYVSGNGQPTTAPALHFQILDGLGTRRVQTNADGQPETDIQSLPYGDALVTANDEYAPVTADDATPLHFTGKERDAESGNDYFGARYYESAVGRWLSPDWSAKVEPVPYARMDNPQSLNLYTYVGNNPLVRVDPDGHCAKKDEAICARITKDLAGGADSSAELSSVNQQMQAQQQNGNEEIAQEEAPESPEEMEHNTEERGLEPLKPGEKAAEPSGRIPGAIYPGESGPLPSKTAKDFNWYIPWKLDQDTTFYRTWGGNSPLKNTSDGTYYSLFPREGSDLFWRNQNSLLPEWGNTMERTDEVVIPKGTTVYMGPAAPVSPLTGGGFQVWVPNP